MHDALDAAAPELRRCSALVGEPLVVEFTTIAGGDRFDSVASGSTLEAVDRCVHNATAALRFQPQAPENFTQEYTP